MMHWSTRFVGLPWADRGRDRAGCDCWGLVRLVYADVLGISLPTYVDDYPSTEELREIDELIRGALGAGPWIEITDVREFDVVLFGVGRFDSHIGVMVDPRRMLHMMGRDAAKIEAIDTSVWSRRRRGVWRHRDFETSSNR